MRFIYQDPGFILFKCFQVIDKYTEKESREINHVFHTIDEVVHYNSPLMKQLYHIFIDRNL